MGAFSSTPSNPLISEPGASLAASSDEWLARLVGRASERAFVALYHRYHDPLYRYVWSIARNEADAQDALQSTWTRVLVALRHGRRDAPVRPWLYRIAHNETITVLRRRGRDGELLFQFPQPVPSAEESALDRERLAQLVTDLQGLAERPRSALLMRELNGLSHQEIAEALDISVGAAKQSILAARQGLADCAQGRATDCEEICRKLSSADRRVLRGRQVRAHLKHCESCSAFAAAMHDRRAVLRQLVPALPPAASVSLLARVLKSAGGPSAGAGLTGGGAAASSGTGLVTLAGKTAATSLATKLLAAVATLTATAVTVGGLSGSSGAAPPGSETVPRTAGAPGVSGPVSAQPRSSVNASTAGAALPAAARHVAAAPGPDASATRSRAGAAPHAPRPRVAPAAAIPTPAGTKPAITSLHGNGKPVGYDGSEGHSAAKANPGHSTAKTNPGHSTAKTNPGHSTAKANPGHSTAKHSTAKTNPGHSTARPNPGHSTVSNTTALSLATTTTVTGSHSRPGQSSAAPAHDNVVASPAA